MSAFAPVLRALETTCWPPVWRLAVAAQARRFRDPVRAAAVRAAVRFDATAALAVLAPLRARLAATPDVLTLRDYGAGTRAGVFAPEAVTRRRAVAEIYARAALAPAWGRLLYALVRTLQPTRVLELGTNLGVGAAHLQLALAHNGRGGLVTLEGDPTLAAMAEAHLAALTYAAPTQVVVGRFAEVLPGVLAAHGPFDFVFLDGHHEAEATQQYVRLLLPHLREGAALLFDDIEPGRPVRQAWRAVRQALPSADALDLGKWGLLFVPSSIPFEQ